MNIFNLTAKGDTIAWFWLTFLPRVSEELCKTLKRKTELSRWKIVTHEIFHVTHLQVLLLFLQSVDVRLEGVESFLVRLLVLLLLQNGFVELALNSLHFLVALPRRRLQFLIQLK